MKDIGIIYPCGREVNINAQNSDSKCHSKRPFYSRKRVVDSEFQICKYCPYNLKPDDGKETLKP